MKIPKHLDEIEKSSALLCLRINRIIQKYSPSQKNFLIAFSGGADSTALTIIFNILSTYSNFSLTAMHINHGIRIVPVNYAQEDADFVNKICNALDIRCIQKKLDIQKIMLQNHCGIEEAGRIGRYSLLLEEAEKINNAKIILGHHSRDLTEDILMRLLRGTGWPGLGGMRILNDKIFRPLLHIDPLELREFLIKENIPWREDESNLDLSFKRNRIRHTIFPLLQRENPQVLKAGNNLNLLAECDEEYWQTEIIKILGPYCKINLARNLNYFLKYNLLRSLHRSLRLRIYIYIIKLISSLFNLSGTPCFETLWKFDDAISCKKICKIFEFSKGINAKLLETGVIFFHIHP